MLLMIHLRECEKVVVKLKELQMMNHPEHRLSNYYHHQQQIYLSNLVYHCFHYIIPNHLEYYLMHQTILV